MKDLGEEFGIAPPGYMQKENFTMTLTYDSTRTDLRCFVYLLKPRIGEFQAPGVKIEVIGASRLDTAQVFSLLEQNEISSRPYVHVKLEEIQEISAT